MQRDVRADSQPFNFPGMKIVPALASIAIIWILAHATLWEFEVNGIVLVVASVLYWLRTSVRSGVFLIINYYVAESALVN